MKWAFVVNQDCHEISSLVGMPLKPILILICTSIYFDIRYIIYIKNSKNLDMYENKQDMF